MAKEKVKKFWNEHKETIIGGVLIGGGLLVCYKVFRGVKFEKHEYNYAVDPSVIIQLCDDIDGIKGDSTAYVPMTGEEFAKLTNGHNIISCGDGTELLNVKGLIAFGNKIEAES